MPVGRPRAPCSAAWHRRASRAGSSTSAPSARATATSSAALEDNPTPAGSVERTVPVKPCAGRSTATTPATYRAHGGSTRAGSPTSRGTTASPASVSLDSRTTSRPGVVAPLISSPRSIAIGKQSPPV